MSDINFLIPVHECPVKRTWYGLGKNSERARITSYPHDPMITVTLNHNETYQVPRCNAGVVLIAPCFSPNTEVVVMENGMVMSGIINGVMIPADEDTQHIYRVYLKDDDVFILAKENDIRGDAYEWWFT